MLAIAGGKGGSGKTTTTIGLAAASDEPVLVADADRDMPNLHALARVDREPTLAALAGRGDGTRTDVAAAAHAHPEEPGVSVLPAPRVTEDVTLETPLARLAGADPPVFVDCPAGAGPDAALPLRIADEVLLISSLCAPALRDTAKTAAMARAVGTRIVGAVLTRTSVAPAGAADLLGCPVLASIPAAAPPVLRDPDVRAAYDRVVRSLERGPSAESGPSSRPGVRRRLQ